MACLHSKGFDFKQDIPAVQLSCKKIDDQMMFTGGDNDVDINGGLGKCLKYHPYLICSANSKL